MGYDRGFIDSDPVTDYFKKLFEDNSDIRIRWKTFQTDPEADGMGKQFRVYTDLQEVLQYTPAIEIVSKNIENNIFAIGTQEEHLNYEFIFTIDNVHPEYSSTYCRIFSRSFFDLLNAFENRSFCLDEFGYPKVGVYYSEATSIDFGFRRGKGLKSAKIIWQGKLLRPNRLRNLMDNNFITDMRIFNDDGDVVLEDNEAVFE